VQSGCNTGGGPLTIKGSTFTVGPLALTRMACPPDETKVETAVLEALSGKVGYTVEADRLTITNGQSGLTLHAGS
jgi:heat shock protein HslJ